LKEVPLGRKVCSFVMPSWSNIPSPVSLTVDRGEELNQRRLRGQDVDVKLLVESADGKPCTFEAHAFILSLHSPYFKGACAGGFSGFGASGNLIHLGKDVDAAALGQILNFLYTGRVTVRSDNVYNLLEASEFLQLDQDGLPKVMRLNVLR